MVLVHSVLVVYMGGMVVVSFAFFPFASFLPFPGSFFEAFQLRLENNIMTEVEICL